jgi:hypothetical protein
VHNLTIKKPNYFCWSGSNSLPQNRPVKPTTIMNIPLSCRAALATVIAAALTSCKTTQWSEDEAEESGVAHVAAILGTAHASKVPNTPSVKPDTPSPPSQPRRTQVKTNPQPKVPIARQVGKGSSNNVTRKTAPPARPHIIVAPTP